MNIKTTDPLERLKEICRVAFYRSVSMMANGCQGIGLLAGADQAACYEFGKHLGMAVFSISEAISYMGKSVHSCSLPVAFASKKYDNILELIQANQHHKVIATQADVLVGDGRGLDWTRKMAIYHLEKALEAARKVSSNASELESLIGGLSVKLY
jgi:geranylgeranyl pyrophosphate synthase